MHRKAPMTKPGARVKVRKKMAYYVARPSGVVREFPMPGSYGRKRSRRRRGQTPAQYRASLRNLKKARRARRRRLRR